MKLYKWLEMCLFLPAVCVFTLAGYIVLWELDFNHEFTACLFLVIDYKLFRSFCNALQEQD